MTHLYVEHFPFGQSQEALKTNSGLFRLGPAGVIGRSSKLNGLADYPYQERVNNPKRAPF